VRAFVMAGGPTILIPNTWPTVLQESATMIPGESVRVHGTTVGPRGIYNCVLVDFLSFPEQGQGAAGEQEKPWWISIEWKGIEQPFVFWDYGQYSLSPLPCQNAPGQYEALNVLVSQFRQYQVPVLQPPAPAPAPAAPEEGKATVPEGAAAEGMVIVPVYSPSRWRHWYSRSVTMPSMRRMRRSSLS
jgi:hypothetical protein